MAKIDIQELADTIVYELEGDVLDRETLGDLWDTLDKDTVDDIRTLWREIIIEHLEKVLPNVETEPDPEEPIDSDFYTLSKD